MSDVRGQQLLDAIDDAQSLHDRVAKAWRWITVGVPLTFIGTATGALVGGGSGALGIRAGGLAIAIICISLFAMAMCIAWWAMVVPRSNGLYKRSIRPSVTADDLRVAKRDHVNHVMSGGR
jgi:hypothetical protein